MENCELDDCTEAFIDAKKIYGEKKNEKDYRSS